MMTRKSLIIILLAMLGHSLIQLWVLDDLRNQIQCKETVGDHVGDFAGDKIGGVIDGLLRRKDG